MPTFARRAFALLALALAAGAVVPAAAQSAANGQVLYDSICRACHGFPPAGGPETAAGNTSRIGIALATVAAMQPFNFLTGAQIADIAAYLLTVVGKPPGPPPSAVPGLDATDLWWNENESGWGLNLIQHPSNIVFGVMYTYEAGGRPGWFVIPGGTWSTPFVYTGALYRVTGPSAAAATFDPNLTQAVQVGTATLNFLEANRATFTFSVDGTTITKIITRQPF